jgi:hypothetical protein
MTATCAGWVPPSTQSTGWRIAAASAGPKRDSSTAAISSRKKLTGHSIGRWEGDTLIVDTIGFEPGLFEEEAKRQRARRPGTGAEKRNNGNPLHPASCA